VEQAWRSQGSPTACDWSLRIATDAPEGSQPNERVERRGDMVVYWSLRSPQGGTHGRDASQSRSRNAD
jgi:hypothetical protein